MGRAHRLVTETALSTGRVLQTQDWNHYQPAERVPPPALPLPGRPRGVNRRFPLRLPPPPLPALPPGLAERRPPRWTRLRGGVLAGSLAPSPSGIWSGWSVSTGYLLLDQPLDRGEVGPLLAVAKRDGDARRPRPRGAADAVHVGLRIIGQVEVKHVRNIIHVDAAGSDIGRDQHVALSGLETVERCAAGRFGFCCRGSLRPRRRSFAGV